MPDGSDKVHCSVMVTGAAQTIYFEPQINAETAFANLGHLGKSEKLLWVGGWSIGWRNPGKDCDAQSDAPAHVRMAGSTT